MKKPEVKSSSIFTRDEYPELFDLVIKQGQYWLGEIYFMKSAGGHRVRCYHVDSECLPEFAGKSRFAPARAQRAYEQRRQMKEQEKTLAAGKKAAEYNAWLSEETVRFNEFPKHEFVELAGGSPTCKICGTNRRVHT